MKTAPNRRLIILLVRRSALFIKFELHFKINCMEDKDLRIGNYVVHNDYGSICKIEMLLGSSMAEVSDAYTGLEQWGIDLDKLKPLEINEKIILWLGFTKQAGNIYKNKKITIELYECKIVGGKSYNYIVVNGIETIEIKYVHQFQNLYYAITGEELSLAAA